MSVGWLECRLLLEDSISERSEATLDQLLSQFKEKISHFSVDDRTKATIIFALLVANAFVCLLAAVLIEYIGLAEDLQRIGFIIVVICFLNYLVCIAVFYFTLSYVLTGNIFATVIYGIVNYAVYMTGGYMSPVFQLFLVIPVYVFMISELRWGLVWSAISILTLPIYFVLPKLGFEKVQILSSTVLDVFYLVMPIFMSLSVVASLCVYQVININLKRQLRAERDQLAHRAAHDHLTGLVNREEFRYCFQHALDLAQRNENSGVLIYIDLDGFKPINDKLGHQVGDLVLKEVAGRLKSGVRAVDTAARLGGDEFAVILSGIGSRESIGKVADKLISVVSQPMEIDGLTLQVSASAGVALFPEQSTSIEDLVKLADDAMYRAKKLDSHICFARD